MLLEIGGIDTSRTQHPTTTKALNSANVLYFLFNVFKHNVVNCSIIICLHVQPLFLRSDKLVVIFKEVIPLCFVLVIQLTIK
jgi:hypothetical protein